MQFIIESKLEVRLVSRKERYLKALKFNPLGLFAIK